MEVTSLGKRAEEKRRGERRRGEEERREEGRGEEEERRREGEEGGREGGRERRREGEKEGGREGGRERRREGGKEERRGEEEEVKDYLLVNISSVFIRTAVACAASSFPMSLKWSRPSNARLKKMLFHM